MSLQVLRQESNPIENDINDYDIEQIMQVDDLVQRNVSEEEEPSKLVKNKTSKPSN